jgi:hypothetical protein
MKSRIIAIFILIFSLNANSYYPLFLAQKHLDQSSEKLIIEINSVSSEIIYPNTKYPKNSLDFYDVKISAQVQFVGQSDSGLHEGDIIYFSYTTTQYKPNIPQILCGHQPITIPKVQRLCIVYLNQEGNTFKLKGGHWSLQVINDARETLDLDSHYTPEWVKVGLNKIVTTTR